MNRKILGLATALALLAGCEFAKTTKYEGPIAQCRTAGGACTQNAECCSYGCDAGVCVRGTHEGTVCKTTNDCGTPDFSFTQMLCKAGACATPLPYCRDDGDICTSSTQCCGYHCSATVGGSCVPNKVPVITVNGAVQTVPRNQPWPMTTSATASDPDPGETATLAYGWTFSPTVTLTPSNIVPNPTFNPGSTVADYLVTLTVTDTWGATATATFTLHVVNTPPVVTPAVSTTSWDRNNVTPRNVAMRGSDANGDTLNCTWTVCRAGGTPCLAAPAGPGAFSSITPPATPNVTATFPAGLAATNEGPWDMALTCTDGLLPTTGTTVVTVTNSPPAITVPATRTFNLGVDTAGTPNAVIAASASDSNGDAIDSWSWFVLSAPPTSAVSTATLGASASTATATFKPDVAGDYALTVTACDPAASNPPYVSRAGACSTRNVLATVYPYIRALGHDVTDAAFHRGAISARLVLVGLDSAAGAVWDYALPGTAAPVKTSVAGAPTSVALTPDGATALAADAVNLYKVALAASPTLTTWSAPFSVGDVIAVSTSDAIVFPQTIGPAAYYQRLNLSNGTPSVTSRNGTWGAAVPGTNDTFFVADTYYGALFRMRLQGANLNQESVDSSYAAGKIWGTGNGAHLVTSAGAIYAVPASSPPATLTALGVSLGLGTLASVDTSPDEAVLLAIASGSGTVARFNGVFSPSGSFPLPHWGNGGIDRGVQGLFTFVSTDGATGYAVVKTTSPPIEYGLYTFPIP